MLRKINSHGLYCFKTHLTVDGILDKVVHEGGDGGVQHEGDEEEEAKHADDAEGAEEEGGVVLDVLQPALGLLGVLAHGWVGLCHDGGWGVRDRGGSGPGGGLLNSAKGQGQDQGTVWSS